MAAFANACKVVLNEDLQSSKYMSKSAVASKHKGQQNDFQGSGCLQVVLSVSSRSHCCWAFVHVGAHRSCGRPETWCISDLQESLTICYQFHNTWRLGHAGEGVLGVDDRVGEGTTGKGRADAWAFPAGDPLARKAFSSGTATTEPIPKKRKTSDSGAAQDVTVFTHPAENGGGGAASIPDSQRVPGETLAFHACSISALHADLCYYFSVMNSRS